MNAQDFCYWLQGFFEMTETNQLSQNQVRMIREHLKLVFEKVTPPLEKPKEEKKFVPNDSKSADDLFPPISQKELDEFEKKYNEAKKWGTQGTICGHGLKYC